ncbi:glycosyhydrolase [Chryseobacterium sp. POL2]|uniref:glycosyl hydrolase 115 family protein n=1 Tax=Chryseobacterium sp. POL2 TaxID=2713414 RepID=UPI0013E160AA|nr:glycosyl hydrolase 115 family protein [Chryseobacterium sp. POL2]QIG88325.1 glycosyhydrolase [Chryseobacterium sp. POL2]
MKRLKRSLLIIVVGLGFGKFSWATEPFIINKKTKESIALKSGNAVFKIYTDASLDKGVLRAVQNLQTDVQQVLGAAPSLYHQATTSNATLIIVGTLGQNSIIEQLVKSKAINANDLKNKREKYIVQNIKNPFNKNQDAIVIAGSDKRGAIYGVYEFSKQIGVSPWHYWADVPVEKKDNLYFKKGTYTDGEPEVELRGIFLNDEEPSLGGWARHTYGGFNSKFYEKVFELVLRLKGNYMWPAMWGSAFYDDDPQNGELANEMGIVMGTSHHEPMALAQQDWRRYIKKNNLPNIWDYNKNAKVLNEFWTKGIERSNNWERLVTMGMRGDGDEAMEEGTNISLLENIVNNQRKIIEKSTGKKANKTPQVWALYKEVQDYYDAGMRVPDDVMLLFCDDNWGNVRKLPDLTKPLHKGGYGMYYHFDYVGGPRNTKWINISPIQRIWEQMNLTYEHEVKKLWVVNVGDLKPMEFPISFFMDMAWDPKRFNQDNLMAYTEEWASQQFGEQHSKAIARMINLYTKYNRRVTPEMLDDKTYNLENYNEFERVVNEYQSLALEANRLYNKIPQAYKDAYFQLVLYPIDASSNLYEMYFNIAKNKKLASENKLEANVFAEIAKQKFEYDTHLSNKYNNEIAGGKWKHMMDQIHIGYTNWQQPQKNEMPKVLHVEDHTASKLFKEQDGYVSIEAENFARKNNSTTIEWKVIPDFGKTKSGITTFPQKLYPTSKDDLYVEYDIDFATTGTFDIELLLAPTLNFNHNKGLRYELSLDGKNPQTINFNGHYKGELAEWQAEHIIKSKSKIAIDKRGKHSLRFKVLEPGIVLQKILINTGGLKPSYLGAPESPYTQN